MDPNHEYCKCMDRCISSIRTRYRGSDPEAVITIEEDCTESEKPTEKSQVSRNDSSSTRSSVKKLRSYCVGKFSGARKARKIRRSVSDDGINSVEDEPRYYRRYCDSELMSYSSFIERGTRKYRHPIHVMETPKAVRKPRSPVTDGLTSNGGSFRRKGSRSSDKTSRDDHSRREFVTIHDTMYGTLTRSKGTRESKKTSKLSKRSLKIRDVNRPIKPHGGTHAIKAAKRHRRYINRMQKRRAKRIRKSVRFTNVPSLIRQIRLLGEIGNENAVALAPVINQMRLKIYNKKTGRLIRHRRNISVYNQNQPYAFTVIKKRKRARDACIMVEMRISEACIAEIRAVSSLAHSKWYTQHR